ncbi:MAG: CTP synthase [Candidatus Saccharibacteria bacterium]|nr:CTP synthase [Candidatus Saccharibacteria bacterium]
MKNKTKYIFVTGGVISGVGKGIMAASIGAILKAKGLKVSMQKCDPYFNVDAGLLNPREHGECYVTQDGDETDLDLGHYERFLDEEMTGDSIWTSGKLYKTLIDAERSGKFGGKTVQLVPHVTSLIQKTFIDNTEHFDSDVHIVEIGGTVGDIEGLHFIEAIREFSTKVGRENCLYVHVCFVPWLATSQEFKTKPAQNSLRDLREFGIVPDMVVARMDVSETPDAPHIAAKLATFCGVSEDAVVLMPDAKSVYEVPLNAVRGGVLAPLERFIDHGEPDMSEWEKLVTAIESDPKEEVKIGLVAKYVDNTDTYLSVTEALKAAAWKVGVKLKTVWINAEEAKESDFEAVDGIVVPGGFGVRGVEGKIAAATYCLKNNKPYLGLCLGMQCAVIAAARIGGIKKANSEEFGAEEGENVVYIMEGQEGKESTGGTMRLGNYPAKLVKGSKMAEIYGTTDVVERHRHRYEVNQAFIKEIEKGGLKISGTSPDGSLVEFIEAPKCDYFVATQGHPEYRSRPYRAHPLFEGLIKAAKK